MIDNNIIHLFSVTYYGTSVSSYLLEYRIFDLFSEKLKRKTLFKLTKLVNYIFDFIIADFLN